MTDLIVLPENIGGWSVGLWVHQHQVARDSHCVQLKEALVKYEDRHKCVGCSYTPLGRLTSLRSIRWSLIFYSCSEFEFCLLVA